MAYECALQGLYPINQKEPIRNVNQRFSGNLTSLQKVIHISPPESMMKLDVVNKTNQHESNPRVLGQVPPRTDIHDMKMSKKVDKKDYHVLVTLF